MKRHKKLLSIAIGAVIYASNMLTASASVVTSLTIQDENGDGVSGAFRFSTINDASVGIDSNGNPCYSPGVLCFTGDVAATPGPAMGEIDTSVANPVNTFSTGFTFAGAPFRPMTTGPIAMDISSVGGSPVLTLTGVNPGASFPFGGTYGATSFALGPETLAEFTAANGGASCSGGAFEPFTVDWLQQIDATHFEYKIGWSHCISDSETGGSPYDGFHAHWRLEGIATIAAPVPVPAAMWLLGSGLMGLMAVARRRKMKI